MKNTNYIIGLVAIVAVVALIFCFTSKNKDIAGKPQTQDSVVVSKEDSDMYNSNKAAYPKTMANMNRFVIDLPAKQTEGNYKVEVLVGKTEKLDCNNHMLNGAFESKTVTGFGFDYLVFNSDGKMAGTLMACPDNTLTEKFVSKSTQLDYNSKLPIVVFAPKGFSVKYNILSSNDNASITVTPDAN